MLYNQTLSVPIYITAEDLENMNHLRNISVLMHEVVIDKADSALTVEIYCDFDADMLILLDYERMPTYKYYQFATVTNDPMNDASDSLEYISYTNATAFRWSLLEEQILNRTGRWYISVMKFDPEYLEKVDNYSILLYNISQRLDSMTMLA